MKTRKLLWQLFPVNLMIILGALVAMTWYAASISRDMYYNQLREGLVSKAHLIAQQVAELATSDLKSLQEFCRQGGRRSATRITVVSPDGRVLGDSSEDPVKMGNHASRPELKAAFSGQTGYSIRYSRTLGRNMLYVAIPLSPYSAKFAGALRVSVPASAIENVVHSIYFRVAAGCILVILAAGLVTLIASRKIVRPLEEMKRGAERLAGGDTKHLIAIDTGSMSTEMYGLAQSLNRMAREMRDRINTITMQHNELQTVFASMAEMVIAVDTGKKIIRLNRSAAALFYLSPEEVKGKILHGVIRNNDLNQIVDLVLCDGDPVEQDVVLFVGSDKVYLHTRAVPLEDKLNKPIGVLIVMKDMTRLRKLENLRRDFVANVSHELKTPVTSIRGYVETLLEVAPDDPEEANRFLEIIARQTARLNAIIDDLLTLSRIEQTTDQEQVGVIRARMSEILSSAVLSCQQRADEKKISLTVNCDDNLFARINPSLIEQAVINLVVNGITYSSEGKQVTVSASLGKQAEQGRRLTIEVEDQGIGIKQEHHERLFERFYRTDKARSSASGGTGLGLSIVKHIAVAHSGSVSVASEPGRGSTFTLSLPQ